MGKVIVAPEYVNAFGRFVFLSGPIIGAPNWQREAVVMIHSYDDSIVIAAPCRDTLVDQERKPLEGDAYYEQMKWEQKYLEIARKRGVTLFWCAKEIQHFCHRDYGQKTCVELGEALAYHKSQGSRFVVGYEEGFCGTRYIRERVDCGDSYYGPICCATLEETVLAAIGLLPAKV